MPYIYGTGIKRGKREMCVTLPDWPVSREQIEIGLLPNNKEPMPMVRFTREEVKALVPVLQEFSRDPLTEEERSRRVAEIEALTEGQIRRKLADNGIEPWAGLAAYPKAKAVIFQGFWLDDSVIYDMHIRAIARYLRITTASEYLEI